MNGPLRFDDEFGRHKTLDLIGDLASWACRYLRAWKAQAATLTIVTTDIRLCSIRRKKSSQNQCRCHDAFRCGTCSGTAGSTIIFAGFPSSRIVQRWSASKF